MKINTQILLVCLSTSLAPFALSAQLVSDDFELKDGIELGEDLASNVTAVGNVTYTVATGHPNSNFIYGNDEGGVAKVGLDKGNVTNSFAIPSMPTSGVLTYRATINMDPISFKGGIPGPWIGLTAEDSSGILHLVAKKQNEADYLIMRFLPLGPNAGKIQLTTQAGGVRNHVFSSEAGLSIVRGRDYILELEYNLDSNEVTARATDASDSTSTSVTVTLVDVAKVSQGQFDFTSINTQSWLEDLPYYKNISVSAKSR